jgi:hypothetical protein
MRRWGVRALVLALLIAAVLMLGATAAFAATVTVTSLQPSWTAAGGGGVYAGYYGPPDYSAVSPGSVTLYAGRTGAPIAAGLATDPTYGDYEDQGLLAFKPGSTPVATFASQALGWDVANQSGALPVWVYIELNKGGAGDVIYQFVPSSNPSGWHTVNAAAGSWYQWTNLTDGITTGPALTLAQVAAANTGKTVDRVYINLGMGNAYHDNPAGTVAYVNNVVIGSTTYEFAIWNPVSTGSNVTATSASGVSVKFATVSTAGTLTVSTVDGPAAPNTFSVGGTTYDVTSTAAFGSGGFDITVPYDPAQVPSGKHPRLFHYNNGQWEDITTSADLVNHTVTGHTTSFSPYGVFYSNSTSTPASSTWTLLALVMIAMGFIGWRTWERARA